MCVYLWFNHIRSPEFLMKPFTVNTWAVYGFINNISSSAKIFESICSNICSTTLRIAIHKWVHSHFIKGNRDNRAIVIELSVSDYFCTFIDFSHRKLLDTLLNSGATDSNLK